MDIDEQDWRLYPANPGLANRPPRSPLVWQGGKFLLAPRLIPLFPAHVAYVEVFGGALHTLFRKERSPVEVVNDMNGELVNFWRVLSRNPEWFIHKLRYALYSRQVFNISFGTHRTKLSNVGRFWRITSDIEPVSERLRFVIIEQMDWRKLIGLYDNPHVFFYLDPPYEGCEEDYGKGIFRREDFAEMAALLEGIKGKFLLSVNDSPFIRETFKMFQVKLEPVVSYGMGYNGATRKASRPRTRELVFGNYEEPTSPLTA